MDEEKIGYFYVVYTEIGRGGQSIVHLCHHINKNIHEELGPVAVKSLFLGPQEGLLEEIKEKAEQAMNIEHPNIATVLNSFPYKERYCIVLEYISGMPLRSEIVWGGTSVKEVIERLRPIAEALDFLHNKGLVHGRIHPENIKITENGTPKILDIGFLPTLDHLYVPLRTMSGVEVYLSPEQLHGNKPDHKSDQYTLALIAFEMLSGRLPWERYRSSFHVLAQKASKHLKSLREVSVHSHRTNYVVMRGLASNGEDRFENCVSFIDALSEAETIHKPTFGEEKQLIVKGIHFPLIGIEAGSFMMGALPNDVAASNDEAPRHNVTLTKSFWMSKYPCTQELYEAVMGTNPSYFKGNSNPVEQVSWCDAVLFCNKLSEIDGREPVYDIPEKLEQACKYQVSSLYSGGFDELSKNVKWNQSANGYRLPTEAEWEYCARGGEEHLYAGSNNIGDVGWYSGNGGGKTHPVGQKTPNGFGLYDMSGNVFEWVWDSGCRSYNSSSATDPINNETFGPYQSDNHVFRGGSWHYNALRCRVSIRLMEASFRRNRNLGFRILRSIS